ncbi:platelet endothelial cell adhesion molecule isoform X2 [Latimeria chalumnae]|uniref:Ig-like domain-containing protein n=1 Tax=Latimeria chalumnae TaxID=7897 RepID=H3B6D8_LATCH|nr:PREDICTED: platelet endothelial cell adhesion molecule-like isoform X2 [Latimeria chalumnae]|eukprot:XP_005993794.1 PREDICTED: platelet endothelial cell adhesion molecule-like isoform X2 [Latimeria chalumnae]
MFFVLWAILFFQTLESSIGTTYYLKQVNLKANSLRVKRGDTVILTCQVDMSSSSDTGLQIKYSFHKKHDLLYNVSSSQKSQRYELASVHVSHSGFYCCVAEVGNKKKKSSDINIKVTGLPKPLLKVHNTEVKEGEDVQMTCTATDGIPPFIFTFYKRPFQKTPSQESNENNKEETVTDKMSSETSFAIDDKDEIVRFTCSFVSLLMYHAGKSPESNVTIVTVIEQLAAPEITVHPSSNVTEGTLLNLTCTTKTAPQFSGNVLLMIEKEKHIISMANNTVYYSTTANLQRAGEYKCVASVGDFQKDSKKKIIVNELFSKPELSAAERINEHNPITLQCTVKSVSQNNISGPVFAIYQNRNLIHRNTSSNNTLIFSIKNATVQNQGTYTCKVTIQSITKESAPVNITVYAPVSPPRLTSETTDVILGHNATLQCKSEMGSPPVNYTLLRAGEVHSTITVTKAFEQATFTVTVNKTEHYGEYRCTAENRISSSKKYSSSFNFTVIAPITGVTLTMIPVDGVEEGEELILLCIALNASKPITYKWYKGAEQKLLQTKSNSSESHAYLTITTDHQGTYCCSASNRANTMHSAEVNVTVKWASWKKIMSSVVLLLIAIGTILACLYFQKFKKAKSSSVEMSGKLSDMEFNNQTSASGQANKVISNAIHDHEENDLIDNKEARLSDTKKELLGTEASDEQYEGAKNGTAQTDKEEEHTELDCSEERTMLS